MTLDHLANKLRLAKPSIAPNKPEPIYQSDWYALGLYQSWQNTIKIFLLDVPTELREGFLDMVGLTPVEIQDILN